MPTEPATKRTVAFFDGQNLFHAAKEVFGYTFPNYDPPSLAARLCTKQNWCLHQVRFYTGVPDAGHDLFWHTFWSAKLAYMGKQPGVVVYRRALRYGPQEIKLGDGASVVLQVAREKGIDVRIALDVIRLCLDNMYDVALIFSQDQDLSEVAEEVREISVESNRWIKIASAFPVRPGGRNERGINKTDWIPIDRALYDSCIDQRDYRSPKR